MNKGTVVKILGGALLLSALSFQLSADLWAQTIVSEAGQYRISNSAIEVLVSKPANYITSIKIGGGAGRQIIVGTNYANAWVRDGGLAGTIYRESNVTAGNTQIISYADSVVLIIRKTYGAGFPAKITFTIFGANNQYANAFRWDVQCTTTLADRELGIYFNVPMISSMEYFDYSAGQDEGWKNTLMTINDVILPLDYRQSWAGRMMLPFVSFYSKTNDDAVSFVEPFNLKKPNLRFSTSSNTAVLTNYNMHVGSTIAATAALFIVPHPGEGDFRPALRWMLGAFPTYLSPKIQKAWSDDGYYLIGGPTTASTSSCPYYKSLGVSWVQIHGHFPYYGLYGPPTAAPDQDPWKMIIDRDDITINDWEANMCGPTCTGDSISYGSMNQQTTLWDSYGMTGQVYYQSPECWYQYASKYYPSSVAKDSGGNSIPGWYYCWIMNADTATGATWGNNLMTQLSRMIVNYPNMGGIMMDRDDYCNQDFAHDDGVSRNGANCYNIGFSTEKINVSIFSLLHANTMTIWSNGPTSIEVCNDLDGVMSEGLPTANNLKYTGIGRPLILLPYDVVPMVTEQKLRDCLVYGYQPSITQGPAACMELDAAYLPLLLLLKGRRWSLYENALVLPDGLRGNMYYNQQGESVAAVVNFFKSSQVTPVVFSYNIPVTMNGVDGSVVKYGYLLSSDYTGVQKLDFSYAGLVVNTTMPAHLVSSVIYLAKTKKYELTRVSSPIMNIGVKNSLIFSIDNLDTDSSKNYDIAITTPWAISTQEFTLEPSGSKLITVDVYVPAGATEQETNIYVTVNGAQNLFTSWIMSGEYSGGNDVGRSTVVNFYDSFPGPVFDNTKWSVFNPMPPARGATVTITAGIVNVQMDTPAWSFGGLVSSPQFQPGIRMVARVYYPISATYEQNMWFRGHWVTTAHGYFRVYRSGANIGLICNRDGSNEVVAGTYAISAGWHTIQVDWATDHITVYYDGTPRISTTDQRYIPQEPLCFMLSPTYASATAELRCDTITITPLPGNSLRVYTPSRAFVESTVSNSIGIEILNSSYTRLSYNGYAAVSSSSATGLFSGSAGGPWYPSPMAIRLVSGETSVYYYDSKSGSPTITTYMDSYSVNDTWQVESVQADAFTTTPSYMVASGSSIPADGITSCTITVFVTDKFRSPVAGRTVTLQTTNGAGNDTVTYPYSQVTDIYGRCIVKLVSTRIGFDTPTATVSGSANTITNIYFQDDQYAMWPFDEGAGTYSADVAGGNTAKLYNGMGWIMGKYGYSLSSDGTDNYAEVYHSSSINYTDSVSVEAWILPSDAAKNANRIISKGWPNAGSYILQAGNNQCTFALMLGGAARVAAGGVINNGQWYHVVGTYDGNTIALYVNGSRVASAIYASAIGNTSSLIISGPSASTCFNGRIDEARIYNKPLTAAEVIVIYNDSARPISFYPSYKLLWATSPRNVLAGAVSNSISVTVWSDTGVLATWYNTPCYFVSSSPTGMFNASASGGTWSSTITLKFVSGETRVYYKDTKAGSPTVSVYSGSQPLWNSQIASITAGVPSNTCSFLRLNSSVVPANGVTACTIVVNAQDCYRNPLSGRTITLKSANVFPSDSISYPYGQTSDASGQCVATIVSTISSYNTVTATVAGYPGNTITVCEYTDIQVLAYDFEEGSGSAANDFSGDANNGTLYGAAWSSSGRVGTCADFTGSSGEYVNVPHSTSLDVGGTTSSYSIEFWYYATANAPASGDAHFFTKWSTGNKYPFSLVQPTNQNRVQIRLYDGLNNPSATSAALTLSTWYHIVCVRDIVLDRVYVYTNGGGVVSAVDNTTAPLNDYGSIKIGQHPSNEFRGMLDEVRMYNRALTAAEIYNRSRFRPIALRFTPSSVKISIVTPFRRVTAGTATDSVAVQALTSGGARNWGDTGTSLFQCSSPTGRFAYSKTAAETEWYPALSVSINGGEGYCFFKDARMGSPTITVAYDPLPNTWQVESIPPDTFSCTCSYFIATKNGMPADEANTMSVKVLVTDSYRNPLRARTVSFLTSNPSGYDTFTPNPVVTDTSGFCTSVLRTSYAGKAYIYAIVSGEPGETITAGYFRTFDAGAWTFEENTGSYTADAADNGNSGAIYNYPSWAWPGAKGSGMDFFANSEQVVIPHSDYFNFGDTYSSYSVEFWFKSSNYPLDPDQSHFLIKQQGNYTFSFVHESQPQGGQVEFRIWDNPGYSSVASSSDLTDGQWHYIAGVKDGNPSNRRIKMYVDGNLNADQPCITGNCFNTGALIIGTGMGYSFYGAIDEVRISTYALSTSEVQARYANRAPQATFTASRLKFTAYPASVQQGQASSEITAEAQGKYGGTDLTFTGTASLLTSSSKGKFSLSSGSWSDITIVTFSQGAAAFYYKDIITGVKIITIQRQGFTPETFSVNVTTGPPPYPGTAIKTVEYMICQDTGARNAGASYYGGSPFFIYIPESGFTLRTAWIEVTFQCTGVQVVAGSVIGVNGANSTTFGNLLNNVTYRDGNYCLRYNATAAFSGMTGSGTNNGPYNLGINITRPRFNESAKLYLTYEYDEASYYQAKTVRYFAGSLNTALAAGTTQTFTHTPYIPESDYAIEKAWYEIRGQCWANAGGGDVQCTASLNGASLQPNSLIDRSAGTSRAVNEFLYLYRPSSAPAIGSSNNLSVYFGGSTVYCLSAELVITYSYDYYSSSNLQQTIRRYLGETNLEPPAGALESPVKVFTRNIYFPEQPSSPQINSIYAKTCTTETNSINLNLAQNGLDTLAFAVNGGDAAGPVAEGLTILYDMTSQYGASDDGETVRLGAYWSGNGGGSRSSELIYTYEYPKNPMSSQRTVLSGAISGYDMQSSVTYNVTHTLRTNIYLPDTNLGSLVSAYIDGRTTTQYGSAASPNGRFKLGAGTGNAAYILTANDSSMLHAAYFSDQSSAGRITGAGVYNIWHNYTTVANLGQHHITGVVSCVTYLVNSGAASNIQITSDSRTTNVNVISNPVYFEIRNNYDQVITSFNNTVALQSSSGTGRFSASSTTWKDTSMIYVSAGYGTFYYLNANAGNYILTVSRAGLRSDTQAITVRVPTVSGVTSYLLSDTVFPLSDGIKPCTVTVFIKDAEGIPVNGAQVTVQTSRGAGDTVTMVASLSNTFGQCTASVRTVLAGDCTFTAQCGGNTVAQNLVLNPSFEEGAGSWPDNWARGAADSNYMWDASVTHSGGRSAKVHNDQFVGAGIAWCNWEQTLPVVPNSVYVLSGWIKTGTVAEDAQVALFIHHMDAGYTIISQDWTQGETRSGVDWTQKFLYTATQSNCVYYHIGCSVYQPTTAGSNAWFDDLSLKRVPTVNYTGASKLAFMTAPRTAAANAPSDSIVIQAQWENGAKATEYNELCYVTTTSGLGRFSPAQNTDTWTSSMITLKFASGETYFYYRDVRSGSPALTVTSGVLSNTSQVESITPDAVFETTSFLVLSPRYCSADGKETLAVSVKVMDKYYNPIPGKTVIITTTRAGANDTITQPGSATDTYGCAAGSVVSTLPGLDTVTARTTDSSTKVFRLDFFDSPPDFFWNFDENTKTFIYGNTDASGYTNTPTGWVAGKYGTGINYPGNPTDTWTVISTTPELNKAGEAFTSFSVEFWFYSTVVPTGDRHFNGKNYGPFINYTWSFVHNAAGYVEMRVYYGETGGYAARAASSNANITDGTWHHIVGVRNAANHGVLFYLDGNLTGAVYDDLYNLSCANPADIWIGWGDGAPSRFNGRIDDMKVYRRALSDGEVALYAKSRTRPATFLGASKLCFVTPARTITANSPTFADSIVIQGQFDDGSRGVNFNDTATIWCSRATGLFSTSPAGTWSANSWMNVKFVNGETYVYFKDTKSGSPAVHIFNSYLSDTFQTESIAPNSFSNTVSYILADRSSCPADGASPVEASVTVTDHWRNPIQGRTVTLYSANGAGRDTITYPGGQVTDESGVCVADLVSANTGYNTITAAVSGAPAGNTITAIEFKDIEYAIWNFEDVGGSSASDISGHNFTANFQGAPSWVTGRKGHCLLFDAWNNLKIPDSAGILLPRQFTVSAWINPSTWDNGSGDRGRCILTKYGDPYNGYLLLLEGVSGQPSFHMARTGIGDEVWNRATDPDTVPVGEWHHVAGTWNGNTISIYTDGVLKAANTGTLDTDANYADLGLGIEGWAPNGTGGFSGYIDELRVYGRALGNTEVSAVYQGRSLPVFFSRAYYRLNFITPVRAMTAGSVTAADSIAIRVVTETGVTATWYNTPVILSSSSSSGRFAPTAASGTWSSTVSLNFVNGETYVFYRDTIMGSPSITALIPTSQSSQKESIRPGAFANTASYMRGSELYVPADGTSRCTVSIVVNDRFRNPIKGLTGVAMQSSNGAGIDTIAMISTTTDTNGTCTATLRSSVAGNNTITATVSGYAGQTITFTHFRDMTPLAIDFEESLSDAVYDASPYGNNGSFVNNPTWVDGKFLSAVHYESTALSYMEVPHSSSIDVGYAGQNYSVECWVKTSSIPAGTDNHFFIKYSSNYAFDLVELNGSGLAHFRVYDGVTGPGALSDYAISDGAWHHIVGVRDGSAKNLKIYVDGYLNDQVSDNLGAANNNNPFRIGNSGFGGCVFTGDVDGARIYTKALSDGEVWTRFSRNMMPVEFGATKLTIKTPAFSAKAGVPSGMVTVAAEGSAGNTDVNFSSTVTLSSSSNSGSFSVDGVTWFNTTSIFFTAGVGNFYYMDNRVGWPVITAYRVSLIAGTQKETITPADLRIVTLAFNTSPNSPSPVIIVIAVDGLGNTAAGWTDTVSLLTSSNSGSFSVLSSPWTNTTVITLANGVKNFYYKDGELGNPVITVSRADLDIIDTQVETITGRGRVRIISPAFTVKAGGVSEQISAVAYTAAGDTDTGFNDTVALGTDSNSGSFSLSADPWENTSVITFLSGWGQYYYKDNAVGTSVISVSRDGMDGDTQAERISPALNIISPEFTVNANETAPMRVRAEDGLGNTVTSWTDTIVLSTDSAQGYFSVLSSPWTNTTTIYLISGARSFYYKDGAVGNPVITAERADLSTSDTQSDTITSAAGGATQIVITSPQFRVKAGDISPQVKAVAEDAGGDTDLTFNNTVSLATASNSGYFSVSNVSWANTSSITFSSGVGTFYYRDYAVGFPVLTADHWPLTTGTQTETISIASLQITNTPGFTITSISTASIMVRARDGLGNTAVNFTDSVALSSSSLKGKFSLSGTLWSDTTSVSLLAGSLVIYYKDKTGGNPIITVSRTDSWSWSDTQQETVTRPIVSTSKAQYNMRSGETGSMPIRFWPTDTVEYTIYITNTGTETSTGNVIIDTKSFDTSTNNSVDYVYMDTTGYADTWAYTTDPTFTAWITGNPPSGSSNIKGLRWTVNSLGINATKAIRFRVRIK